MSRKSYRKYLKSAHWKALRAEKKKKTGIVRCAICASMEKVQTHHLQYKNLYDVTTEDLRLLCARCHEIVHILIDSGILDPKKYKNSNGIFSATKAAVKKALGLGNKNLFYPK